MDLQSVPGVGTKTAEALSALDDPERALREGDVAALARPDGCCFDRPFIGRRSAPPPPTGARLPTVCYSNRERYHSASPSAQSAVSTVVFRRHHSPSCALLTIARRTYSSSSFSPSANSWVRP